MDGLINTEKTAAQKAAHHLAEAKDRIIRDVLDTALGAHGWALSMLPERGHLVRHADGTEEIWWEGRHLATIKTGQATACSGDGLVMSWRMYLQVEQHIRYS